MLKNNRHIVGIGLLVYLLLGALASYEIGHYDERIFNAFNVGASTVCIAAAIAFSKAAVKIFIPGRLDGEHLLAAGIVLFCVGTTIRSSILWVWRAEGQVPEMINYPPLAMVPGMMMAAGILCIAASGVIEGTVPPKSKRTIAALVVIGFLATAGFIWALDNIFVRAFLHSVGVGMDSDQTLMQACSLMYRECSGMVWVEAGIDRTFNSM